MNTYRGFDDSLLRPYDVPQVVDVLLAELAHAEVAQHALPRAGPNGLHTHTRTHTACACIAIE
jgi:hypothetical protein